MKTLTLILCLLAVQSAFAAHVDGLDPRACKVVSKKHETVVCDAAYANVVNTAKADAKNLSASELAELRRQGYRPETTDARELGLLSEPDTKMAYNYARILRDGTGEVVGVLDISGYTVNETSEKVQVALRLNMQGRLTKVSVK